MSDQTPQKVNAALDGKVSSVKGSSPNIKARNDRITGLSGSSLCSLSTAMTEVLQRQARPAKYDTQPSMALTQSQGHSSSSRRNGTGTNAAGSNSYFNFTESTVINVVNSQNVQVGYNNTMNVYVPAPRPDNRQREKRPANASEDSDSDEDDSEEEGEEDSVSEEIRQQLDNLKENDSIVTVEQKGRIAKEVGGKWRSLLRALNLKDDSLDNFEKIYGNQGHSAVAYQLLCGLERLSVSKLAQAIHAARLDHLLQHLVSS